VSASRAHGAERAEMIALDARPAAEMAETVLVLRAFARSAIVREIVSARRFAGVRTISTRRQDA
jgi:hypothetical protein